MSQLSDEDWQQIVRWFGQHGFAVVAIDRARRQLTVQLPKEQHG